MPWLRVKWPFSSYDFGNGIPPILADGTLVSEQQQEDIDALLLAMRPKDRPRIEEFTPPGGGGGIPTPIIATRDWVLDRLAEIGAPGSFVFEQSTPAASWNIQHDMGTKPQFVVQLDSDPGTLVFVDTTYTDLDHVLLVFPSPETGKVYI